MHVEHFVAVAFHGVAVGAAVPAENEHVEYRSHKNASLFHSREPVRCPRTASPIDLDQDSVPHSLAELPVVLRQFLIRDDLFPPPAVGFGN